MSNRSPKILWPIDYSLRWHRLPMHWCNSLLIDDPLNTHRLLYCTRKTFLAFLYLFYFVSDSFICVRRIFPCIWNSCWRCREAKQVLITNIDNSHLCNISLYSTLYLITEQLNSNQPVWKWNSLTSTLTRIDHVVIDFFVGVCRQSKTASALGQLSRYFVQQQTANKYWRIFWSLLSMYYF